MVPHQAESEKVNEVYLAQLDDCGHQMVFLIAGVRPDLLPYVVDKNPAKQGKFLPGSRISIVAEERLHSDRPAYIVILPWNIKAEVMEQMAYARDWGAKFVTAVPRLRLE
jgi:hypothetical protein